MRSELLSGRKSYRDAFLPLEAENKCKDETHEAETFFEEVRLAPFDGNVDAYIRALVALNLRRAFTRQFGAFKALPLSSTTASEVEEARYKEEGTESHAVLMHQAMRESITAQIPCETPGDGELDKILAKSGKDSKFKRATPTPATSVACTAAWKSEEVAELVR